MQQMLEVSKSLDALKLSPEQSGDIIEAAAPVVRAALISAYFKVDKSGLGGRVSSRVIIKRGRKRPDRVYIGPDWEGENEYVWNFLQWGTVLRSTKGQRIAKKGSKKGQLIGGKKHSTGVMPAYRFMDKALEASKSQFIKAAYKIFEDTLKPKLK